MEKFTEINNLRVIFNQIKVVRVINYRSMLSLHGGLFEITLTVP